MHPYTTKGRRRLASMFFESLLEGTADESDAVYGLVAESMEYPADRSHVVFNMRPQAKFSDGTPLTAADVVFSYETLRDKGLPSFRAVIQKQVKRRGARAASSQIHLQGRRGDTRPAKVCRRLPIFSKAYYETSGADFEESTLDAATGSGPYVLDRPMSARDHLSPQPRLLWRIFPSTAGGTISTVSGSNITLTTTAPSKASRPATTPGTRRPRKSGHRHDFPAIEKGWAKRHPAGRDTGLGAVLRFQP